MAIQRPVKTYGTRTYVTEVALAPSNEDPILASEVDNDLDTVYAAVNGGNIGPASGDLTGVYPGPTVLKAAGHFTVTSNLLLPTAGSLAEWGSRTPKTRVFANPTADAGYVAFNAKLNAGATAWVLDDPTKAGWVVIGSIASDVLLLSRIPPQGTNALTAFTVRGSDLKTVCTLADASVSRAMLQGGAAANGPGNVTKVVDPTFNSNGVWDTWILVDTLPNIVTRGGPVLLLANHGLSSVSITTNTNRVSMQWRRNGTNVAVDTGTRIGGTAAYVPLPFTGLVDTPAAGTWSYSFWVYVSSGASSSVTQSGFNSLLQAIEIG